MIDWKTIIYQIIIAIVTTSFGSFLTYLKSKKEFEAKIKEAQINAKTEITKIKEETTKEIETIRATSDKEIEKIKTEQEELRKTKINDSELNVKEKTTDMQNELAMNIFKDILQNPDTAVQKLDGFVNLIQWANKITESTKDD